MSQGGHKLKFQQLVLNIELVKFVQLFLSYGGALVPVNPYYKATGNQHLRKNRGSKRVTWVAVLEGKLISVESIEICDEGPRAQHTALILSRTFLR